MDNQPNHKDTSTTLLNDISKNVETFFIQDAGGKNVAMIKNHPDEQWQWVSGILGHSSSYNGGWEAITLIGPPRIYPSYGDIRGAWAAARSSGTKEWLELEYERHFYVTGVDIFETYNPGHVCTISAWNKTNWVPLWSGEISPPNQRPPEISRIFSPKIETVPFRTNAIRLDLDCFTARSWSEIDCVLMRGLEEFFWSPEKHFFFPSSFRDSIFSLLCINWREKFFTKDILFEIIRLVGVDWPWNTKDLEIWKKKSVFSSLPEEIQKKENNNSDPGVLFLVALGCSLQEAQEVLKLCDYNLEKAVLLLSG